MLYPLYVHHDDGSAYGGTFPDFPGCFTAADESADLPRMAQEALEVFFDGEDAEIAQPGDISRLTSDAAYQDGFWLLVMGAGAGGITAKNGLHQRLWADYCARTNAAYPRRADGTTLLQFRRLFLVATTPLN